MVAAAVGGSSPAAPRLPSPLQVTVGEEPLRHAAETISQQLRSSLCVRQTTL
jgi:hypothetical protein